jgi:integrase
MAMDEELLRLTLDTLRALEDEASQWEESTKLASPSCPLSWRKKVRAMRQSTELYLRLAQSSTTVRQKTSSKRDEVENLFYNSLDPFDRQDLADIIVVASYTGLRQGELLKLKAIDIDLSSNTIHVGGRPGFTTKSENYRSIPIHDRIKDTLRKRMECVSSNVRLFGDEWNDKDQLYRAFVKVRNYVGKDDTYVFHSLRHSFATWCVEAGVPMRTLMELMGHKRIDTTLRYAKVSSKAREDAISLI